MYRIPHLIFFHSNTDISGCIKMTIFKCFKNLDHVQSWQLKNGQNSLGAMYHVILTYILISLSTAILIE